MMKSFFKKLAFVMALAMVVTMAAPAGTSALAAGIYLAEQNDKTKTAVTEVKVDVEKTYDLRFYGAPTNWKEDYKWTSDDETVATVNQDGLITGVKDGETVVTFRCFEEEVDVKVVVGAGKAATGYTVTQPKASIVNVLFNGTTTATADDIQLYYVLDGGYEVSWPIKETKAIDGGFSVEPYVAFEDGASYKITVLGDEGFPFTTNFGVPTHLEIVWKCNGVENGNGFVDPEGIDSLPVEFEAKFFSGDVDVTALYNQNEVVYNLEAGNEEVVYLDSYEGNLFFDKAGEVAIVSAEYIYYDAVNEVEVPITGITDAILSVNRAPYEIKGLVDWSIVKKGTSKEDFKWGVDNIRANDDAGVEYILVAKFLDSFGNYVVTDQAYACDGENDDPKVYGPDSDYKFKYSNLQFQFTSALPSKMLIGKHDATLTTYTKANVATIISLHDNDGLVKNAGAVTVVVTDQRKIDRVLLNTPSISLVTDGAYTTQEVTVSLVDQYGDAWVPSATISKSGTGSADISIAEDDDPTTKGVYKVTLDGKTMKTALDGKYSTSITLKAGEKTATLRVSLKDPKYNDGNAGIRTTGWELNANDINQKLASSTGVKKNTDGSTYEAVLVPVVNEFSLTQESNGLAIGIETDVELYDATTNRTEASVGDRFIVVYDTNGDVIKLNTAATNGLGVKKIADGKFGLVVANPVNNVMKYLPTGTYTVKVKEVTSFKADSTTTDASGNTVPVIGTANYRDRYTKTFKITNDSYVLEYKGLSDVKTQVAANVSDLVHELVLVNLNGAKWNFKKTDIVEVKGRYNDDAGYVIITSVTFKVPLNAADTTEGKTDDTYGYTQTVYVNQAIEMKNVNFPVNSFGTNGVYTPAQ